MEGLMTCQWRMEILKKNLKSISRLSAVEEVATYDTEDHIFADGDDSTNASSCCESTTKVARGSTTDDDDGATTAKRARLDE